MMWFSKIFYKNLFFRYSCSKCHYCNTERPSDITLADFWGWEKINPKINLDDKGVSLVLLNTEKGRQLWNHIVKDMDVYPAELKDCIQRTMVEPTPENNKRKQFEKDYTKYGFKYVYKKNYDGIMTRMHNFKKNFFSFFLKDKI